MNVDSPANGMAHVDEVNGLLYIEGQLEAADARGVVAHLGQCADCRRLLDTLKRESLLLREALTEEDEPLPASLLAPRISEGLSWIWLSAFSLAAAGVYVIWTYYLEPWLGTFQQSGFGGQFFFTWLLLNGASWKGWDEMLQWVILGSLGVLASVVLFLFRRNLRRISSLSMFLAALLLMMLALPSTAQGSEFVKSKTSFELREDKTVATDLFVFAPSARVSGTVEGDLFCFCSSLNLEGHVTGDVFVFASVVRISGKVDGSVRSFTGSLLIEGDVTRNVLSFVGSFQTTSHSNIGGSATLFAGDVQLDGPLGRDLNAYLGGGDLNAPIGGDVLLRQTTNKEHRGRWLSSDQGPVQVSWTEGEQGPVQVGPHADIKGSFRARGPFRPEVAPEAHLASTPQFELREELPAFRDPMAYWYNAMIWGAAFMVGLVLISLSARSVEEAAGQVARIGWPLLSGFGAMIFMPIVGLVACATVVGLGLGVPILFVWVFLIFFAQVFAAVWVGELILGARPGPWALTGRLALGLLLIRLGALIPHLGGWVRFLAGVLGFGALTLMAWHRIQGRPASVSAAPPAAAGA